MGTLDGIPPDVGRVRNEYILNRNRPIYEPGPVYDPDPWEPAPVAPVYQPYHAEPLPPLPNKPLPPLPAPEPEPQPQLLDYEPMPDAVFRALMRAAPDPAVVLGEVLAPPPIETASNLPPVKGLESLIDPDPRYDNLRHLWP